MILFPIFVLETETNDMSIIHDVKGLQYHVEEFWDILDEDFKFWDNNGFPIKFERTFLEDPSRGYTMLPGNEFEVLKTHVLKFAESRGYSLTTKLVNKPLSEIVLMVAQEGS